MDEELIERVARALVADLDANHDLSAFRWVGEEWHGKPDGPKLLYVDGAISPERLAQAAIEAMTIPIADIHDIDRVD